MSDAVTIALISLFGTLGVAVIGLWVEQRKTRKQVTANSGSSMFDAVSRIEAKVNVMGSRVGAIKEDLTEVKGSVKELREDVVSQGERIARLEVIRGL